MNGLSPLVRAARLIEERLAVLEGRIRAGEETAWGEYVQVVQALVAVQAQTAPGAHGELLTTAQLAQRLQLSTKTVLRKAKRGEIAPPQRLAARGRGALRWRTS